MQQARVSYGDFFTGSCNYNNCMNENFCIFMRHQNPKLPLRTKREEREGHVISGNHDRFLKQNSRKWREERDGGRQTEKASERGRRRWSAIGGNGTDERQRVRVSE